LIRIAAFDAIADLGITPGMRRGIEAAETAGVPVDYRNLASFRTQNGRAAR
jgi:hypothetical protein